MGTTIFYGKYLDLFASFFEEPDLGKDHWFQLSGGLKKWGVKLQCLTGEGKFGLIRIIRNFDRKT